MELSLIMKRGAVFVLLGVLLLTFFLAQINNNNTALN